MATKSMWRLLTVMSAAVFALAIAASAFAQSPPAPPNSFYGSGATLDGEVAADGSVVTAWDADGVAVGMATITDGEWKIDVTQADASSVVFSIDGSTPSDSYEVVSAELTSVTLDLHSPMDDTSDGEGDDAEDGAEDGDDADDMGDTDDGDADDMGDTDDGDADDMGDTDDADDMGDTDDADDMGDTEAGDGDDAEDMGDDPMALPDTGSGGLAGDSSLPVLPLALAISVVVALGGVMAVRRTRA